MEKKALELLDRLLAIRSVNGTDREADVAEFLADYFTAHGIEAQVQHIDEKHANVIAFVPGKDPKRTMIWNGHLDTVPYGSLEEWQTDPAVPVVEDGRLYARGASDMKSGLAAMVFALCHLPEAPACNLQFLGTCDEEKNGLGAEWILKEQAMRQGSFLLVGEPTDLRLGTAQKGCLWLELSVKGRTSHGAYPQNGTNAAELGMRLADAVRAFVQGYSHPLLGSASAQVTMIESGVANNMTPDRCRIVMDVRMVPPLTTQQVFAKAKEALAALQREKPELQAQFRALNDRRAIEIDPEHPQVAALQTLVRAHGYEGSPIGINFFTDASVLDRSGEKDILLFGPGDPALAHQPNEYVVLEKYQSAWKILQAFACKV